MNKTLHQTNRQTDLTDRTTPTLVIFIHNQLNRFANEKINEESEREREREREREKCL